MWNLNNPHWDLTKSIVPLDRRGQVLKFVDNANDAMIVKFADNPVELENLTGTVYREAGNWTVPSVVDGRPHVHRIRDRIIKDNTLHPIWENLGHQWAGQGQAFQQRLDKMTGQAATTSGNLVSQPLTLQEGKCLLGREYVANEVIGKPPREYTNLQSLAQGPRTEELTTKQRINLLYNDTYMINLGRLVAFDVFLYEGDRAVGQNLGNWFTDPDTGNITALIDLAGIEARGFWLRGNESSIQLDDGFNNITVKLDFLSPGRIDKLVSAVVHRAIMEMTGAKLSTDTFAKEQASWLNSSAGEMIKKNMHEMVKRGIIAGCNEIKSRIADKQKGQVYQNVKAAAGAKWWPTVEQRAKEVATYW
jgi:hypothetical protein